MDFVKLTEQIIRTYLGNNDDDVMQLVDMLDENISVIGTGKQEIYRNVHEYAAAIKQELEERKLIQFQIENLSCTEQRITEDVVLVFGNLIFMEEEDVKRLSWLTFVWTPAFPFCMSARMGCGKWRIFIIRFPMWNNCKMRRIPKRLYSRWKM